MNFDFVVIGAGISGAAAAFELALHGTVAMIEAESSPGYHSTGRSAALFTPNYGSNPVRILNQISANFFKSPPDNFCESNLLTPRGCLYVALPGKETKLEEEFSEKAANGHNVEFMTASQALNRAPVLRTQNVGSAVYEPDVMDIDVATLHQGFLRGFKKRGGTILCNKRVCRIEHTSTGWEVLAEDTVIGGGVIVNAAGAWADEVGALAGALPIGLVPKRRTVIIVEPPKSIGLSDLPCVGFWGAKPYFQPEVDNILACLGDQTPVKAQDIRPDEMDIALLVDWLERMTKIKVSRIGHSWAGLRSFVSDESPVVGFDPQIPDFFWLAGQGGYGIMMSPTLGQVTAELIIKGKLPSDLIELGLRELDISPIRLGK